MTYNLLKGKKGIVFGALNDRSIAWKVAEAWQLQFSEKVPLSWYIFIGGMLLVHAVILAVSSYNVHRIAYENPSNSLKTE